MKTYTPVDFGIAGHGNVYHNLSVSALVTEALRRGEGVLTDCGALSVNTGKYTGRSPHDKFIVDTPEVHDEINWGEINRPISAECFARIRDEMHAYLQNKDLFVFDGFAGADPSCRQRFRVLNEFAFQNLFIHQLLIRPSAEELEAFAPDYTILAAPGFSCIPESDGVNSEAAIIIDYSSRTVLIAGTMYCGEIKKSVFSVMNYILPKKGILPMHCSASTDASGNCAVFFGLSGTGKTTLSSDPSRTLIGDDEHGWSDSGIFNIEGGCYAKCINLSLQQEPDIYHAIKFGTVLENVVLNDQSVPDYSDHSLTYNTRAAYPISYIDSASAAGSCTAPKTILFLTADAFGVFPPISRLDTHRALYYYMSGYTSKVSGTELGISDPVATFSAMFGAPFFPLRTEIYAALFREKLEKSGCRVYLVNTGWCGGRAGDVPRIKLRYTRAIVDAAISGALDHVEYAHDDVLDLDVPLSCPGVPAELLDPSVLWKSAEAYEAQKAALVKLFSENFDRNFPGSSCGICGKSL